MLLPLAIIASFVSSALALVHGVDSSQLVSEAAFADVRSQGFTKAIIRGYQDACSVVRRTVCANPPPMHTKMMFSFEGWPS